MDNRIESKPLNDMRDLAPNFVTFCFNQYWQH
ncbi:hypothetical protein GOICGAJE_04500 [Bacillus sp. MB95]|nr:hypothetical protein [Bacillus sp. MB95]